MCYMCFNYFSFFQIPATAAPPYPECLSSPNNNTLKSFINFHYPAQASMGEHTRDMRLSLSFPYQECLSRISDPGRSFHNKSDAEFIIYNWCITTSILEETTDMSFIQTQFWQKLSWKDELLFCQPSNHQRWYLE